MIGPSANATHQGTSLLIDFSVTLTPRLYETDAMGHINNASIAAWFEVLRVRFMESLDVAAMGKSWILASVHIDYVGETFYGEDVTMKIVDAVVGNTSITFHGEMHQGDRKTVKGSAVLVHMDYETKTTVRVPDAYREAIEQRRAAHGSRG